MPDDNIYYHAEIIALPASRLEFVSTTATETTLEWTLSDGRVFSYTRHPINIGNLTASYRKTGNGKYFYKYTLDNRLVQHIRVGEIDHFTPLEILRRVGRPIFRGPDGWRSFGIGWGPSWDGQVTRCEMARYTILSDYLPGPVAFHFAGSEEVRDPFPLPFDVHDPWERHLMQQIEGTIAHYGTSVDPIVIGPTFKRNPAERDVRNLIHQSVALYGFPFLRPLDDANVNLVETVGAIVPGRDFEAQILDCLKVAIGAMIADNPAAPQIEKARAARKARRRLAARGITTIEQAHSRLRSFRAAQEILHIVSWKLMVAREKAAVGTPEHSSRVQMEEQKDARVEAITGAKMFAAKWKKTAEQISVNQQYYNRLGLGLNAAIKRLDARIETLHLAYDLKVSGEICKGELVRRCARNLAKIQAESVIGIHLSQEEANASLSVENWQLIDKESYGPDIRRRLLCQAGAHQLRADVWTDLTDESIGGISLQLVVQARVRQQDGSEYSKMLASNTLLTLQLDPEWELGKSLLRYPSM